MPNDPSFRGATPSARRLPTTVVPAAGASYPGKTLGTVGTVGTVVAFVFSPLGVLLCLIAYLHSRNAGYKNYRALSGLIFGCCLVVLGTAIGISSAIAQ